MRITPNACFIPTPERLPAANGGPRRNFPETGATVAPSTGGTAPPSSGEAPVNPFASWVTCTLPLAGTSGATGGTTPATPPSLPPVVHAASIAPGIPRVFVQPSILMGGTVPGGGAATAPEGLASLLQQEADADPGVLNLAVLIQSGGLANAQYDHTLSFKLNLGGGAYSSSVPWTYALDDTTAASIASALGGDVVKGPAVNPEGSGAMGPIPQVNYISYKGHLYNAGTIAMASGCGLGSIISNLQQVFAGFDAGGGQTAYNLAQIGPMGKISNPTASNGQSSGW